MKKYHVFLLLTFTSCHDVKHDWNKSFDYIRSGFIYKGKVKAIYLYDTSFTSANRVSFILKTPCFDSLKHKPISQVSVFLPTLIDFSNYVTDLNDSVPDSVSVPVYKDGSVVMTIGRKK